MDFKVVVFILDLVNDMLPVCCQYIAVLTLKALCDVGKCRVELGCCRDISALRDCTGCAEMTS